MSNTEHMSNAKSEVQSFSESIALAADDGHNAESIFWIDDADNGETEALLTKIHEITT